MLSCSNFLVPVIVTAPWQHHDNIMTAPWQHAVTTPGQPWDRPAIMSRSLSLSRSPVYPRAVPGLSQGCPKDGHSAVTMSVTGTKQLLYLKKQLGKMLKICIFFQNLIYFCILSNKKDLSFSREILIDTKIYYNLLTTIF